MRPASRTSSSPLTSSAPIFRRPTVGRSRSNSTRAMALPMTARSTRCLASAPIVAPTSRTIDSPRKVGHNAAMAGRSIPTIVLRWNLAIAIRAPVLPAEIATSASPFLTASIAIHMDDFHRPRRNAWLGLSSIFTATSVWVIREIARSAGRSASNASSTARLPTMTNSVSGCRSREMPAPATTTGAPWSPPMASRAMRTFCGIDRPWRGPAPDFQFRRPGARSRRGTIARRIVGDQWLEAVRTRIGSKWQRVFGRSSISRILELRQCCKRTLSAEFLDRRRKSRTWFARIRVDTQQEELGRNCADIGRAVGQNLGRLVGVKGHVLVCDISCRRSRKDRIDRLIHHIFHRFECDHTGLSDRGGNAPCHPQTAAVACEVDRDLKSGYVPYARERGKDDTHVCISDKIEMQPGFRNILKADRDVPRLRWLRHGNHHLVSPAGSASAKNGVRFAKCKLPAPRDVAALNRPCVAWGTCVVRRSAHPAPRWRHGDCRMS